MTLAIVLAVVFMASPVLGYWVLASRLPNRTKLRIAIVGMAVLVLAPLVVVFLSGD